MKQIALILSLCLFIVACGDQDDGNKSSTNQAKNTSTTQNKATEAAIPSTSTEVANAEELNGEEVELTEEDLLAMDLVNEEIFLDKCTAYAEEDKVAESDLQNYLDECMEQLKAEASVIIEPEDEAKTKTTAMTADDAEKPKETTADNTSSTSKK